MKLNSNNQVDNIKTQEIVKKVTIGENECCIYIQDAFVGELNGKQLLLDKDLLDHMMEGFVQIIKQNYSKYNPIPTEIVIRHEKHNQVNSIEKKDKIDDVQNNMIESYEPRFSLDQVSLNEKVRQQINTTISAVLNRKRLVDEWGMSEYFTKNRAIIVNFYGIPGTGKSMTAEAIASKLKKRVYSINYSELESKYVGETPKNIKKAFEIAKRDDAVLIFDEADSFLGKRLTSVTQSADYGVNITRSVLLLELEKFDGIVIFTTNLIKNYDEAFRRRILANIYFEYPDEKAREDIWGLHLNDKIPLSKGITKETLAKKYCNITGADIKDIIFYAAIHTMELNNKFIDEAMFDYAYELVKQRYEDNARTVKGEVISNEIITKEQFENETRQ